MLGNGAASLALRALETTSLKGGKEGGREGGREGISVCDEKGRRRAHAFYRFFSLHPGKRKEGRKEGREGTRGGREEALTSRLAVSVRPPATPEPSFPTPEPSFPTPVTEMVREEGKREKEREGCERKERERKGEGSYSIALGKERERGVTAEEMKKKERGGG